MSKESGYHISKNQSWAAKTKKKADSNLSQPEPTITNVDAEAINNVSDTKLTKCCTLRDNNNISKNNTKNIKSDAQHNEKNM